MLASLALDFSVGIAGAFFDEKDAMYSLKSEAKLNSYYFSPEIFKQKSCGASNYSFANMQDKKYVPPNRPAPNTPRFVRLKYLIPSYGTNEKTEQDKIQIQIFSDAIGTIFQCGLFSFNRLDFLSFNNLDVPCREEVIVSILEHDFF